MSARSPHSNAAVEAAICAILTAEREAQASVEQSVRDAESTVEAARAAARVIEQRTERRIGTIRAVFEQRTRDAVAQLSAEASEFDTPHALSGEDGARATAAAVGLAAELTGASD